MNFRITTLFFALLLTMLWVFGLMIAQKKAAGDKGQIVKISGDVKIDRVVVKTPGDDKRPEVEFVMIGDRWFLKEGKQQARVEGFKIEQSIIKQIRDAKHDETADIPKDAKMHGLTPPQVTVTLSGGDKNWEFFVGKENADQTIVYVSSSDYPEKVFAVNKKDIDGILFKNANYLRSRRLWDTGEPQVTGIDVKKTGKDELELARGETSMWTFVKPPLGPAGTDAPDPEEEKKDPHADMFKKKKPKEPEPKAVGGVKSLLSSVLNIRVDDEEDLEPLGKAAGEYGLDPAKADMRIELRSTGDKKEAVKEVLLIGAKVTGEKAKARKGDYYYAKLDSDDGVMMIAATYLEPILKAVDKPGELRSHDIASFDPKKIDAIVLKQGKDGKDEIKFFLITKDEETAWYMVRGDKKEKASETMVRALIEQVQGKKAIVKFLDEDPKTMEPTWGLTEPSATIALHIDGIDHAKKEEKKDDKKDDKGAKKDEKTKKDDALPALKKDHKAVITLAIGNSDKDRYRVRRTLEDQTTQSRFTVKKEFVEKILPSEGVALAYLDSALPAFSPDQAWALKLQRTTDKGVEVLELERRAIDGKSYWYTLDKLEPSGAKLADPNNTDRLLLQLGNVSARKWIKELSDKDDLDKYGLKSPIAKAWITVKKHPATLEGAQAAVYAGMHQTPFAAIGSLLSNFAADKGETVVFELGKENTADKDKDKPTYAKHSSSKLLFEVDTRSFAKFVKEVDLRDRTFMLNAHAMRVASFFGITAGDPISMINFASPQITGKVLAFDPEKVTKVSLAIRTPFELRTFAFDRIAKEKGKEPEKAKEAGKGKEAGKDKEVGKDKEPEKKESPWTWADKSNIPEFQLDPEKVAQLIKDLSKLETNRFVAYAGGPRGEHKLADKELTVKLDLTFENGKTITLKVGASYQMHGYFANSTYWPEAVYFLSPATIEPLLRGTFYFGKERIASN